jgi:glucose-1-phosphate adenylyltransferase
MPPHFIGGSAVVEKSLIAEGCEVHGTVKGSVLFAGVNIESNAIVEDSVIMPGTRVESGAVIRRSIVSENCIISKDCVVGENEGDIALIGQDTTLPEGYIVKAGEQVDMEVIAEREGASNE